MDAHTRAHAHTQREREIEYYFRICLKPTEKSILFTDAVMLGGDGGFGGK